MVSASLFLGCGSARPASPWPPTTWKRSPRIFCCTSCVQPAGLCPSPPEKWSHGHLHHSSRRKQGRRPWSVPSSLLEGRWGNGHVGQSFDGNGKCVTMAHGLPLQEGIWESDHGLCPSPSERWRSVVMATSMTCLERRGEGGHGLCLSLPGKWLCSACRAPATSNLETISSNSLLHMLCSACWPLSSSSS